MRTPADVDKGHNRVKSMNFVQAGSGVITPNQLLTSAQHPESGIGSSSATPSAPLLRAAPGTSQGGRQLSAAGRQVPLRSQSTPTRSLQRSGRGRSPSQTAESPRERSRSGVPRTPGRRRQLSGSAGSPRDSGGDDSPRNSTAHSAGSPAPEDIAELEQLLNSSPDVALDEEEGREDLDKLVSKLTGQNLLSVRSATHNTELWVQHPDALPMDADVVTSTPQVESTSMRLNLQEAPVSEVVRRAVVQTVLGEASASESGRNELGDARVGLSFQRRGKDIGRQPIRGPLFEEPRRGRSKGDPPVAEASAATQRTTGSRGGQPPASEGRVRGLRSAPRKRASGRTSEGEAAGQDPVDEDHPTEALSPTTSALERQKKQRKERG